ncbi:MAG: hypothetical protein AVO38_01220 [delta proteobacterium ML8_D]|nr:MAG: hypothetical protein AVO38_01220 [delta proteobacterium ML8_D]
MQANVKIFGINRKPEISVGSKIKIMKKRGNFIMVEFRFAMVCFAAFFIVACTSSKGFMPQSTGTGVGLYGNNYKVIRAGVKGESNGFSLFGLIPIVSPNYADAKSNLYQAIGEPLEGRSIALANQTQDRSTLYVILFSIPKITITADIIEFTGAATSDIVR